MNRRIFLGIIILMICLSSFEMAIGSDCLAWEIPLVLALLSGLYFAISKIWINTIYKHGNIQLSFIEHLPQEEYGALPDEVPFFQIKIIPLGPQTLFLKVIFTHGFSVKYVNARFLNDDKSNADGSIIEITDTNDPYYGIARLRDGNFGIEGEYTDTRVLASGQGLYFEINIVVRKPWRGLLSFRAQDTTGFRTFGTIALQASEEEKQMPSPYVYPVVASGTSVLLERIVK